MRLSDINPFVRVATISKMSQGVYISYKLRTRDHRLFYVIGGGGSIVIEGVSYKILPGMVVLFRSGTEYIWQVENMRYIAINFDYTQDFSDRKKSFHVERSERVDSVLEPDVSFSDAKTLNSPVVIYGASKLEEVLLRLVGEFSMPGKYSNDYLSAMMKSLIISVARMSVPAASPERSVVREIIQYIQENYNTPINNGDIAKALHLNPSYMNRAFKAGTGITVHAFLVDYRINAAMELILGGSLSVGEVAFAVGFSDVPHFIKSFKAHTGRSPGAYGRGDA